MAEEKERDYWWVVAPGEFLQEKLEEMDMDVNEIESRIGYTAKTVNEILKAKCAITAEMAFNLEYATGIPASFG